LHVGFYGSWALAGGDLNRTLRLQAKWFRGATLDHGLVGKNRPTCILRHLEEE